ncbi:GNAT family N-acetyltransferase [Georgenia ruanii]|uniref:GNAT family N-acetyltransferase n=1 Tax=Georgenia ruanii TaxID=348442 RepID=A0A7J9URW3_9MICO|nr:GNAT family N-acetyltransferase [Georgenia ruanii]
MAVTTVAARHGDARRLPATRPAASLGGVTSADDAHDDLLGRLLAESGGAGGPGNDPAHAGHAHSDPLRPTADHSVRPALPEDAEALGDIHARTLRATLTAAVGELDPAVGASIDAAALGAAWRGAITTPPSPRHRVLTACAGAQVVGFAAFAPAETAVEVEAGPGDDDEGHPAGAPSPGPARAVAEILALEVPAAHARRGHGSRLLAACVDLLREQGATRVQAWAVQDDESRTRFLSQAGFAPAGVRRTLDVAGTPVTEICWYAEL